MKALYSEIKELVPGLKATPKQVGEALTLTGFMMDGFTEVTYKGKKDYLLSLEIRQNRADCLSVIGLAREVAAYYNLKVSIPAIKPITKNTRKLDIKIEATDVVKRVLAIKLDEVQNKESPEWLKEYMSFYGLNSAGLLVDLSNYVMMVTGYPSHLIDYNKTEGAIRWSMNSSFKEMTTLLGSITKLNNNEIIIRDEKNVLALAGIIGGKTDSIDTNTNSVIAEIAIYDRSIIRKNSRSLSITTEASRRLEKDLDPNGADYAMKMLISLILKHSGGKVASNLFSYYPKKYVSPKIQFDKEMPSKLAGIEISPKDTLRILKGLDFDLITKNNKLTVVPPTYRMDVALPEDLAEEVIRIYGYNHIPTDEVPALEVVKNITPKNIILSEKIRDTLTVLGFDETLSWPLTQKGINVEVNYSDSNEVSTQNSVNELYPHLRQSMATGILIQMNEYFKKGVEYIDIFEIGRVFGEKNKKYSEHDSLGILSATKQNSLPLFKDKVESLLRLLGFEDVKYFESKTKPSISNPESCWDIYVNNQNIGILYKLGPSETKLNTYFAEIDIEKITKMLTGINNNPVVELTQKLISLDVNIELNKNDSIFEYLDSLEKKIDKKNIWSINIADIYQVGDKKKYTLRVTYEELSDEEAKTIHLKTFRSIV
ncbi:phenylalanine--tRNA ligase subunit beta [bacterium]|jgi:phenylalanyl-tRNA synthetase beta chain|nr:phenylalanine--tRNA ligase subunit beta [bacterium]